MPLNLTRKKNETVLLEVPGIGEIEVRVRETGQSRISLAIEAPQEVKILRGELKERKFVKQ